MAKEIEFYLMMGEDVFAWPVSVRSSVTGVTISRAYMTFQLYYLQRFTLELRTLLSFSLDFLASSVGLVCDPRVNHCRSA